MRNESRIRKILPVNLMLEGRPCLVVGSGQIAARKVGHLLEAGAAITVVGPEPCVAVQHWAEEKRIQYRARPFRNADVKGQWLVMAATDNGNVNGAVIQLCQKKGILCSAADAHWTEADFLIPAILRRPHLTVAISTGGESCRRARLVKDYLTRHVDILRSADLMVVSVKRTRPAPQRLVQELGSELHQIWGIHEFMIMNRRGWLDVFAVVSSKTNVASKLLRDCVRTRFMGKCSIREGAAAMEYTAKSCILEGEPRVSRRRLEGEPRVSRRHLEGEPRVSRCRLEGEPRVSRDPDGEFLRAALLESTRAGWAGGMMNDWVEAGIRLADSRHGSRAQTALSGLRKINRDYQRQYEAIIRSI